MRNVGILILLASTVAFADDKTKFYLIAIDGSYFAAVDGVVTKVGAKHWIEQEVMPGMRHTLGYQLGYFGDWTATSFKVVAGVNYYFVFGSAAGRGRTIYQLSSSQGELCLHALKSRSRTQPCSTTEVNLYPLLRSNAPLTSSPSSNLVPGGFR